ncbi:hypothetical protein [uncultured Traorella sp.]|uniref:DUF6978 family protein n=1 Tax=uncultured Traorella sp. TaxID=1929048 RepID=UPI0025E1685E|nr:hypothetical protein [uncultured Traorella sp.]
MTQDDAIKLVEMFKELLDKKVYLPEDGKRKELYLKSTTDKNEFIISINRRSIVDNKCTFHARTKGKNEPLLRLDVNPSSTHTNPDGEVINGTHLHIFKEGYEIKYAIPFDSSSKNLVDHCISFFKKFNVIEDYQIYDFTNLRLFS